MEIIFKNFETSFNSNISDIKKEYYKLDNQIKELENKNNILIEENIKLSNVIEELNKEKKAKASSTIWESMNTKLSEKDIVIEQLKKDIEFYKRTSPKYNITEKWQPGNTKYNSSDTIETPLNLKDVKPYIKQDIKPDVKPDVQPNIKNMEINDDNETENTVVIKKSKDKIKDKIIKKKKIIKEEDNLDDLDDLEKELTGLG